MLRRSVRDPSPGHPTLPNMDHAPGSMKVYFAARYSRRGELRRCAEDVRAAGGIVTSRWLDTEEPLDDLAQHEDDGGAAADRDLQDVCAADVCVSFTEGARARHSGRGGRHVELGVALALGQRLVVVGPPEHVFHCLPGVERFERWSEALEVLSLSAQLRAA
jgi:hypothetical protein